MILIISQNEDHNTNEVIQWLIFYKVKFLRINRGDDLSLRKIHISKHKRCEYSIFSKEKGEFNINQITAIWYRRGEIHLQIPNLNFISNADLKQQIFRHLAAEKKVLEDFLQYLLFSIPHIGTYEHRGVNKLFVLEEARKLGIDIPETLIVSQKKSIGATEKLITKCISEVFTPEIKEDKFITYTEPVNAKTLNASFFPSLFQTLVEKEADIRIFIINDKVYSMAIRSQEHVQTRTDFRKYVSDKPNRCLPFKLPKFLEEKLIKLMHQINLETASVDMVLSKDGRFVFLEANPVGQFGMTSKPCNYYLEREIAKALINLSMDSKS